MLKFLARLLHRRPGFPYYIQQMAVGYRPGIINCDYCWYKQYWTDEESIELCPSKYHCEEKKLPYIMVRPLHYDDINTQRDPIYNKPFYYIRTAKTQQVKIKGWPMYLQYIGCDDRTAQCNAFCYWHNQRLAEKKTVSKCAHQHACSRSGSFWDLLIPENLDLQQQFFNELDLMNP